MRTRSERGEARWPHATSSWTCTRRASRSRPIIQINGGTGFNEVFFDDVRIPDANRISRGRQRLGRRHHDPDERACVDRQRRRRSRRRRASCCGSPREVEIDGAPAIEDSAVRAADRRLLRAAPRRCSYTGQPHALRALPGQDAGARGEPGQARGRRPASRRWRPSAMDLDRRCGRLDDEVCAPQDARLAGALPRRSRGCASRAGPTRCCATSSPSACWACRRTPGPTREFPSRTFRPGRRRSEHQAA